MSELCAQNTQQYSVTDGFFCDTSFFADLTKETTVHYSIAAFNDLSRRDVRALIFHLLYTAQAYDYEESVQSIVISFNAGFNLSIPFNSELVTIVEKIISQRDELEKIYIPFLNNWRVDRISVCTKLILLFGTWELKNNDTDARIIINEAIELAKSFAEDDAYRFVNGILDSVAKELGRKEG